MKDYKLNLNFKNNYGIFYTPTPWVDYAHKMITEQLGDNWKDEYVVWDNCCGSKNLTRDYRFKELYCSTLFDSELEIGKRYNPEATSFQFDFLNDELEKLPKGLIEAFEQNKKIVFFLNPPYARNSGIGNDGKVCFTAVREDMNKNKIGACSANLYCQFLWRIKMLKEQYNLTNCHIGIFCPINFLTGESYKKFRIPFFNNFNFINGIQFKASHFADVSDCWGISFSIWHTGITKNAEIIYNLMDLTDGDIVKIGNKNVYNTDINKSASVWIRELTQGIKTENIINLTSAISVKTGKETRIGKLIPNALGFFFCCNNSISLGANNNALFSTAFSNGIGCSIVPNNINRILTFFCARLLAINNWATSSDEYLAPNEEHPHFNEFVNDSIILSLFSTKSCQSSLRQVKYHDKLWDIKNEFFWMSKSEIETLANEYNLDVVYNDARTSDERFVYNKLQGLSLSPEARVVLEKASELVRKSFKYREMFSEEHPEYQLDKCWDAGFYQIKALLKEYMKDDLKEFTALYKKLADKMRPQVYELGFLKK